MKVTFNLVQLLWCLFFQSCHQLVFGITVPRYRICNPLTRRTLVSIQCISSSSAADDAFTFSGANPAIPQETGGELTTPEITAPISETSSEKPEVTTRNKRPPLASKSGDVYANIYRGLYNLPLEMEEEENSDEVENTSFYSNIRYSFDDDEEIDDFPDVKSSIVSKISDSEFGDGSYSTSRKVPNERPPLISSIEREMAPDPAVDEEIISVNERPPLRRKTPLLVDGFAIQPSRTAAEKTKSSSDLEGIYANIYRGLYNLPLIAEDVAADDDEIENTSFYSNIRYSTGEEDEEEDDDGFKEVRSTLESKLEIVQPISTSSTASNAGLYAANERPPLVSAVADSAASAIISAGEDDSKSKQEQGQGQGGGGIDKDKDGDKDAYPTPSLPCVSTATNSVHIVGERVRIL